MKVKLNYCFQKWEAAETIPGTNVRKKLGPILILNKISWRVLDNTVYTTAQLVKITKSFSFNYVLSF